MKWVLVVAASFAIAVVAFYGAIIAASESGEVVVLTTTDAAGTPHRTRLWAVDHAGEQWVRTGHPDKGWFVRIAANPRVELERAGVESPRIAVPVTDPEIARQVNRVFAAKYGAADWIVAISGSADHRIVVRLDPTLE